MKKKIIFNPSYFSHTGMAFKSVAIKFGYSLLTDDPDLTSTAEFYEIDPIKKTICVKRDLTNPDKYNCIKTLNDAILFLEDNGEGWFNDEPYTDPELCANGGFIYPVVNFTYEDKNNKQKNQKNLNVAVFKITDEKLSGYDLDDDYKFKTFFVSNINSKIVFQGFTQIQMFLGKPFLKKH